jgi:hypothetical protein
MRIFLFLASENHSFMELAKDKEENTWYHSFLISLFSINSKAKTEKFLV